MNHVVREILSIHFTQRILPGLIKIMLDLVKQRLGSEIETRVVLQVNGQSPRMPPTVMLG